MSWGDGLARIVRQIFALCAARETRWRIDRHACDDAKRSSGEPEEKMVRKRVNKTGLERNGTCAEET